MRAQIHLYRETNLDSVPCLAIAWKAFKAFVRGHITQRASFKKKENTARQLDLEKQLEIAETNVEQSMSPDKMT